MTPYKQIICFGGGKDSLALLYLMREDARETLVVFGDTGAIYPHMQQFVHETCGTLGYDLYVVRPPVSVKQQIAEFGAPADLVPTDWTAEMQPMLRHKKSHMIQSRHLCCWRSLWEPVQQFIAESGIKLVLRGAKASDEKRGLGQRCVMGDITILAPLWGWTDDAVFTYLAAQKAELPKHYKSINTSFDCYVCSAYLTDRGARQRVEYTRKNYPHLYPELEKNLAEVKDAVHDTLLDMGML